MSPHFQIAQICEAYYIYIYIYIYTLYYIVFQLIVHFPYTEDTPKMPEQMRTESSCFQLQDYLPDTGLRSPVLRVRGAQIGSGLQAVDVSITYCNVP